MHIYICVHIYVHIYTYIHIYIYIYICVDESKYRYTHISIQLERRSHLNATPQKERSNFSALVNILKIYPQTERRKCSVSAGYLKASYIPRWSVAV